MIDEPLLGASADAKAFGSRFTSAGCKAGVALTILLSMGAICSPRGRIQHVPSSTLQLSAAERIGREKLQNVSGRNTSFDIMSTLVTEGPTEIPPDVLKEAIRDVTGLEGGARCVAAFLFDRAASSACASASPTVVTAVTVVLSLYVLFFFPPFYMFPEAAVAFAAWKIFPMLEKAIVDSPKDKDVPDTMRMGLLLTALVAVLSRLFTLWKERNEPIAAGRQSSMLISLVVGFVIYMIFNFLSGGEI
jgi:hypothetical protein